MEIRPLPLEPIDGMLRRLKKALEREGHVQEIRRHDHAMGPGERRREKSRFARRRAKRNGH